MKNHELSALIALLDDPDKEVFNHVSGKLLTFGSGIIPTLESIWQGSFDPIIQERIENIIHRIQFDSLAHEFEQWLNSEGLIFEGAYLAARLQFPELDRERLRKEVDRIKRSIWLELSDNLTPLEKINVFNHVFYVIQDFSGLDMDEQNPRDYFINTLIERRSGNPLALGILYLVLASELELPVYGVDLSQHFILAYLKEEVDFNSIQEDPRRKVMFYINPINKGTIFTRNEIQNYLKKLGVEEDPSYFVPCSNRKVVRLLLEKLKTLYDEEGSEQMARDAESLLKLI